ncbi:MAG: hypothetical protein ABIA04_11730 [Pseudomonadota bacterium]
MKKLNLGTLAKNVNILGMLLLFCIMAIGCGYQDLENSNFKFDEDEEIIITDLGEDPEDGDTYIDCELTPEAPECAEIETDSEESGETDSEECSDCDIFSSSEYEISDSEPRDLTITLNFPEDISELSEYGSTYLKIDLYKTCPGSEISLIESTDVFKLTSKGPVFETSINLEFEIATIVTDWKNNCRYEFVQTSRNITERLVSSRTLIELMHENSLITDVKRVLAKEYLLANPDEEIELSYEFNL